MSDIYQALPSVVASELDGSAVLLDLEAGRYFALNAVGVFVWQRLDAPITLSALCQAVAENFEVEPERCAPDVQALLATLLDKGLVRRDPVAVS